MKDFQELAKAILYQFMFGDYEATDFKEILEPAMFGGYSRLYEVFVQNPKEKLVKDGKLTTEAMNICSGEKINKLVVDTMQSQYYSFYLYRDLEELIKFYYRHKNADDVFAMVESVKIKNEKLAKMQSETEAKKYKLGVLYDKIVIDAYELSKKTGILGYSTGIPSLDRFTDGLQKGTLMRLTAYSNIGKSKLAYHVCNSVLKQGASALFFSLEVTKERVVHNLLMNYYDKDYYYISRGGWITDPRIDCGNFFNFPLEVIDDIYSLDRIIQYAKNRKPDVIFIDFVQNIQTGKEEYQAMTEVAVKLQQLAISEKIAIFDLSQVSQEQAGRYQAGGKIPSKGSGALVASADVNLVMERDQGTDHNLLHIAKNKFGMNGKCLDLEMNFSTNQVTDLGEHILKSKNLTI